MVGFELNSFYTDARVPGKISLSFASQACLEDHERMIHVCWGIRRWNVCVLSICLPLHMLGLLVGTLGAITGILRSIELKRAVEVPVTSVVCGVDFFIDADPPRWSSRTITICSAVVCCRRLDMNCWSAMMLERLVVWKLWYCRQGDGLRFSDAPLLFE